MRIKVLVSVLIMAVMMSLSACSSYSSDATTHSSTEAVVSTEKEIDNNQKETDVSSPEEIDDYDGLNEDELTDQLVDDADQMDVVPDK